MTKNVCEECGLPMLEFSALAVARLEAEAWLRSSGYSGAKARETAGNLIPHRRMAQ